MLPMIILILSMVLSNCLTKPTTESTHVMLQRLGFDKVQGPVINHHKKRVAQDINKARHHVDSYNTETDSHMYIVKLPPHSPYYSHMNPEKFENEVVSKSPTNFRTNGKPAGVYHWNIPVIKSLPRASYGGYQVGQGDSKVYHVKILPHEYQKGYKGADKPSFKKFSKFKKQRYEDKGEDVNSQKNMFRIYNDGVKSSYVRKDVNALAKKNPERARLEYNKLLNSNNMAWTKNKGYSREKVIPAHMSNDVKRQRGPSYYQPALPKQNSFYKDFTGNGKPKSFYVIEKSKKATRYHRLF